MHVPLQRNGPHQARELQEQVERHVGAQGHTAAVDDLDHRPAWLSVRLVHQAER